MIRRIIHSTSFYLTLVTAMVFSGCVFILGFVVYFNLADSMQAQLENRILVESSQLLVDYQQDGLSELQHDLEERVNLVSTDRLSYFLEAPDGTVYFDDIGEISREDGWSQDRNSGYLVFIVSLDDGYRFGIGSQLLDIAQAKKAVLHAFMVAFFVLIALSIIAGVFISHVFLKKVDRIAQAAAHIGEGSLSNRLPLNSSNDELDKLAGIINGMLDQIQKLIENLQHVSASIAHELRTPLGHIRQNLERIKYGNLTQHDSLLDGSIEQLDKVLDIFAALLRIAEIESGVRKGNFSNVDLSSLLIHLGETYQPVAQDANQTLSLQVQEKINMQGDKILLAQLFANLLENAIQHAGENVTIIICLKRNLQGITVTVADNGIGVPLEKAKHLFKPFYRLQPHSGSKNSGLGLSLVRAIADLHGMQLASGRQSHGFSITLTQDL